MRTRFLGTLCPILGILAAGTALADVPDPTQCTVPDQITLVARGGSGTVDPGHSFTVVVRGFVGQPRENNLVVLDFEFCPDIRICADQGDPGILADCASHTVRGYSAADGHVTFHVAGGALNNGASPGSTGPALRVFADGVFLKDVRVAALDESGMNGMDGNDHSAWLADFMSGQPFARSDFDGDGALSGNDLSLWLAAFFSGASAVGCGSAVCP